MKKIACFVCVFVRGCFWLFFGTKIGTNFGTKIGTRIDEKKYWCGGGFQMKVFLKFFSFAAGARVFLRQKVNIIRNSTLYQ